MIYIWVYTLYDRYIYTYMYIKHVYCNIGCFTNSYKSKWINQNSSPRMVQFFPSQRLDFSNHETPFIHQQQEQELVLPKWLLYTYHQ